MTTLAGTIGFISGDTAPATPTVTNEIDFYPVSTALPATVANTTFYVKDTAGNTAALITGVSSVTGTAPIVSSGGSTPAISISPATTTTAGSMSAADKIKLNGLVTGLSGWIDVTQQGANSVLASNTGAQNNTALANIMAAASSGSTLYFPDAFYPFASNVAVPAKVFVFQGNAAGINGSLSAMQWTSNVAGDLITLTSGNYYTQFRDMLFTTSVPQTAGSVVNTNGNAFIDFQRCTMAGLSSTNTLFNGINYNGSNGGNSSCVDTCIFSNFTGIAIIGACNLESFVIDKVVINGGLTSTTGAVAGINVTIGGAIQIDNSDVIGCQNNLLINPTAGNVVASVFVTNSYFDNSFGSCIKITGTGATVRSKFSGCSFTVAANQTNVSAFECTTTVAAGAQGLDIVNCNILNTFGAASCNGVLITGGADYSIQGSCNIAGWATGLNLTPNATAGSTIARIQNNVIGSSGGYGVNTVGILLNAGSAAYGALEIMGNDCVGNTTPLTNNLTTNIPTNASRYRITDNPGINPKGTVTTPAVGASGTAVTNTTGYRVTVYQKNGTAAPSVFTVNGVAVTAVANTVVTTGTNVFSLDPGGTIAFTYTTAPTMVWVAN